MSNDGAVLDTLAHPYDPLATVSSFAQEVLPTYVISAVQIGSVSLSFTAVISSRSLSHRIVMSMFFV